MSRYVFTNLARSQIGEIHCERCEKPIRVGQKVVSKKRGRRKYYHESCWEKMFIDV